MTEENETIEEAADTSAEASVEEVAAPEETEASATAEETEAAEDTAAEATDDSASTEETAATVETEAAEDTAAEDSDESESTEETAEEEGYVPAPEPDDGIKRRWYAIHAYSGQEANIQKMLQIQADQEGVGDLIGEVLVPMEEVAEIKSGEKKISKRKFFPGYVLVRLPEHPEHNAELWHSIKSTPGVAGFIGSKTAPTPLDDGEVQAIVEEMRGERERPKPKVNFEQGERVKIIDGPFANFLGNIDEINGERGMLKVMVEIFERLTSVEVEFWQVEKM